MTTTYAATSQLGKGRLIALRTLSGILALAFLAAGSSKLAGALPMIELFEKIGVGQWFRYVTGLLEIAGAIGLIIPRYAFYAAVLLALVMVGAVITQLALVGGSALPAAALLMLSAAVAWLRKP